MTREEVAEAIAEQIVGMVEILTSVGMDRDQVIDGVLSAYLQMRPEEVHGAARQMN